MAAAVELLDLVEEFLQTADPDLEDDLRIFLIEKGWHPRDSYETFLDLITKIAVQLRRYTRK